jgi:hypothetical protein
MVVIIDESASRIMVILFGLDGQVPVFGHPITTPTPKKG